MRILVLTTSYPARPGDYRGLFVQELALALVGCKHQVRVVVPHPGRGAPAEETSEGITVERVPFPSLWPQARGTLFGRHGIADTLRVEPHRATDLLPALLLWTLRALDRVSGHDLVLSHWLVPGGLVGTLCAARRNLPHIVVEHGAGMRLGRTLPGGAHLLKSVIERATLLHLVSPALLEKLKLTVREGAWTRRTVVFPMPLPPPADSARETPRSEVAVLRPERTRAGAPECPADPTCRVLFVGRLVPLKGADLLLDSLEGVRAAVTIAGGGPDAALVETRVQRPGLAGKVVQVGEVTTAALDDLYGRHDVLVIPSRRGRRGEEEGSPRVLLEGMSRGLVPVVSDTGGMPAIVNHETNGLVFPAHDSAALNQALRRLAADAGLRRRLARAAVHTAAGYGMESLLDLWRRVVPEL